MQDYIRASPLNRKSILRLDAGPARVLLFMRGLNFMLMARQYRANDGGMVLISNDNARINAVDQILAEIEKTLYEMRSLALYAAQNNLSVERRVRVQARIDELKKEIDGIAAMLIPPDTPLQ